MKRIVAVLAALICASAFTAAQPAQALPTSAAGVDCKDGTLAPLVGVTHYTDGGAAYNYRIGEEIHSVPITPAGFNPMTASGSDLERYGLPARPAANELAASADWTAMMQGWKRNTDTSLCIGTTRKYHSFQPAAGAAQDGKSTTAGVYSVQSGNWAGYVADAGAGTTTYIAAQGDFVHPTYHTSCSPSEEGSWTGIGGYHSGRLIQAGTEMSTNRAWYEYLGNNGAGIAPVYTINVAPGHRIHTYEVIQRSTGLTTFYVYDTYNGVNKSVVVTLPVSTYYDGSSTAYIDERPNGAYYWLRNFSTIAWTNAQAQRTSGTWYSLQSQTEVEVVLVEAGNTLAHPGAMTGSQSFTEHYYHC